MTRSLLFLTLLLCAGCHHEHAEDRVIEARAFVLTNEDGRPRGLWEYRPERKATTLSLLDEQERPRANVMVYNDQPTVNLIDAEGRIRANLALQDEAPSLTLSGPDGSDTLVVGLAPGTQDVSVITFRNAAGTWFSLGAAAEGEGLVVRDANGAVVARIDVGE
jgi:hypothetical protein